MYYLLGGNFPDKIIDKRTILPLANDRHSLKTKKKNDQVVFYLHLFRIDYGQVDIITGNRYCCCCFLKNLLYSFNFVFDLN